MSQLKLKAQKANQTKHQMSLALQSAQITNANINFNFNLPNHFSNSVDNSDQATSGKSKHSASEPLRTVPQIAEHQTNCQDPAH